MKNLKDSIGIYSQANFQANLSPLPSIVSQKRSSNKNNEFPTFKKRESKSPGLKEPFSPLRVLNTYKPEVSDYTSAPKKIA